MTKSWIPTRSGRMFYPLAPLAEDVNIYDIGFALGNLCRFTGHVKFYSVAEHSIHVSRLLEERYPNDIELQLAGLLHDAAEAYINDLSNPVKHSGEMGRYLTIEAVLELVIEKALALKLRQNFDRIKWADDSMLATEVRDLISNPHPEWQLDKLPQPAKFKVQCWLPDEAQKQWFDRYEFLQTKLIERRQKDGNV